MAIALNYVIEEEATHALHRSESERHADYIRRHGSPRDDM